MGQSRHEFRLQGCGDAAPAGVDIGIIGLLNLRYVAKPSKWLLPPQTGCPARAAGTTGTTNRNNRDDA
jgi:hypothetical protein